MARFRWSGAFPIGDRSSRTLLKTFFIAALAIVTMAAGWVAGAAPVSSVVEDEKAVEGADFDIRLAIVSAMPDLVLKDVPGRPGATVTWSSALGVAKSVVNHSGFLTPASALPAETTARNFITSNPLVFRLTTTDMESLFVRKQYTDVHNGATHLIFGQREGGRDVYGTSIQFTLDAQGRIALVNGKYFPGLSAPSAPAITPEAAVGLAVSSVGHSISSPLKSMGIVTDSSHKTTFKNTIASELADPLDITAELVTFPMPADLPHRLAWKTIVEVDSDGWYETLVDAVTGELLSRENYYNHASAQGTVFTGQHPTASGDVRAVTPFPAGWVGSATTTTGNNVNAYEDLDNSNAVGYQPTTGPDQHFDYPFNNSWEDIANGVAADAAGDNDAVITQLFYYTNDMHDYLLSFGFDEASGNFQAFNAGGGVGGDPVLAEAHDGYDFGCPDPPGGPGGATRCINNANFGTGNDGTTARMQMYFFVPPDYPNYRDGSLDGDVIAHEIGHGVSRRLINGGMGRGSGAQVGGMNEGSSDTLSLFRWGDSVIGEYVTSDTSIGIRRVNYATSEWTYEDLCNAGCQSHRDGEVWATAMYALRQALILRHGASGASTAQQLQIDGLKNTPIDATYLDGRDAILAADATSGGSNKCLIWSVFASKGMGLSASSATQSSVTEAFDGPGECLPTASVGGPYNANEGSSVGLSGAGSTAGTDPSVGSLSYAWNFDLDADFDDATGVSPTFPAQGQDGTYPIALKVTNDAGWTDTQSGSVNVTNVGPTISLFTDAPENEGSSVRVFGSISDPGWSDTLSASINWGDGTVETIVGTLENAQPNATLTFDLEHTYGDNAGPPGVPYSVNVVANDDDLPSVPGSIDVLINNVSPTIVVSPFQTTSILESETVTVNALWSDPGWLDTHTALIDWGTFLTDDPAPLDDPAALAITDVGPPMKSGTVTGIHTYMDDGVFPIQLRVRDDDADVGSSGFSLTVGNFSPSATIDMSDTIIVNGEQVIMNHAGVPIDFSAVSQDPGSDDLNTTWDWGDGGVSPDTTTPWLANAPFSDLDPSPGGLGRDVIDQQTHTFGDACLYTVTFGSSDDDSGAATDSLTLIIKGNASRTEQLGYWKRQYRFGGLQSDFSPTTLSCYLAIVRFSSDVFNEITPLTTTEDAFAVLQPPSEPTPNHKEKFDRELLQVLLNMANGAFEYDTPVYDSDKDGILDQTVGDVVQAAEVIRLSATSTKKMIEDQTWILNRVNHFD